MESFRQERDNLQQQVQPLTAELDQLKAESFSNTALIDLYAIRDDILKGLTTGRGSVARTSPQYKAAAKALDRFIAQMTNSGF